MTRIRTYYLALLASTSPWLYRVIFLVTIVTIPSIMMIEALSMAKKSDITKFSQEQLEKEDSRVDGYTKVLILSAVIIALATIFQSRHANRVSQLRNLQI